MDTAGTTAAVAAAVIMGAVVTAHRPDMERALIRVIRAVIVAALLPPVILAAVLLAVWAAGMAWVAERVAPAADKEKGPKGPLAS